MTAKEKLLNKIDELTALKQTLLTIESFRNPNNDALMYSTEAMSSLSGTNGVTPENLSTALDTITGAINTYVDYIRNLPYVKASPIYRERPNSTYAIVDSNRASFAPPMGWKQVGSDYSFTGIMANLPSSEFYGQYSKIEVSSSSVIRVGGVDGLSIDHEIKLIRINARTKAKDVFRSGAGPLNVSLTDKYFKPDDIFIIGIQAKEDIPSDALYYIDFSYSIKKTKQDGSVTTDMFTIGDSSIGNMASYFDGQNGMIFVWDIVVLNQFEIAISNSIGNTTKTNFTNGQAMLSGLSTGNTISSISVGSHNVDISALSLSYREGISRYRLMKESKFELYEKDNANTDSIAFNNLRPISHVLEEAISGL